MNDITAKPCINVKCDTGVMKEVVDLSRIPQVRTGWFCDSCRAWDAAIGRERVVNQAEKV